MKKVLFTYKFEDGKMEEKISLLENLGYEVYFENEATFQYKSYMREIEALMCYSPFESLDIDDFPSLKWIQLTSMGFEQIPVDKVLERRIIVTNNRGGYSIPMGEWVVLNILELIKNRKKAYENQSNKRWFMDFSVGEIYSKKISFIGTGDIAKESVKRLSGFGTQILGVNTNGRSIEGFDKCFSIDKLDYVLSISDVVVICLPHTKKTEHIFNKERLEKMKKDAYLINVSRGAVVSEEDLVEHLDEGNFKGVALDVFEEEPLSKKSRLWDYHRVVITSHNSWISEMIPERRWNLFYENLKRYINKEELLNVVEIKKGY
ncbi:phosphoglycerate dehydrogenase [Clostridium cylindrosporum]|uniref:D-2-hydroxyacid dehydrogenase Ddh n=1 Tax=Clostridium cylindrosporum DSM 605 TaxID=1121307 RepID=A0A0J8D4D3_CLOCY|nr:D-2-hydroxyacid dehydrogenase Ddh [Clostridium cylindrosporum DSM 605]